LDFLSHALKSDIPDFKLNYYNLVAQAFPNRFLQTEKEASIILQKRRCTIGTVDIFLNLIRPPLTPDTGGKSKISVSSVNLDVEPKNSSLNAESTDMMLCEICQRNISKQQDARGKKRKRENSPDTGLHDVFRPNLVNFLAAYWKILKVNGLYNDLSVERF
jgi:hypothetical protein